MFLCFYKTNNVVHGETTYLMTTNVNAGGIREGRGPEPQRLWQELQVGCLLSADPGSQIVRPKDTLVVSFCL